MVSDGVSIPAVYALYLDTDYGVPANLSCKEDMILTPQGVTTLGWAENEAGDPVSGLTALDGDGNPLKALDPDTGLYETVTLNTDPSDDNILIGTTTSGNVAFIAVIVENPDGLSSDVYLLDYLPKEHLDDTTPDDTLTLSNLYVNVTVDQSVSFDFAGAPSGNNVFMAFGQPGPEGVAIVVTGRTVGEDVNSSQAQNQPTSLAANSNNINAGEGLAITYVNDMDPQYLVPGLTGPEAADPNNIQFGTLQTATEASLTIVKVGPGSSTATVVLTAQYTADGTIADGSGGTTQEEGTAFIPGILDDNPVDIIDILVNGESHSGSSTWSFSIVDGVATVEGINTGDTITFFTLGDHNRVLVENGGTGNARFNIGDYSIADIDVQTDADPITLVFYDDGPAIDLTLGVGVLQTDDGDLAGGNEGDGTGTDTDTKGLGSLFSVTSSTGADDANATDDIVYSLEVGNNAATTLVDTATNEAVTVSLNGSGVIEGRTTGTNDLVFTVSVNAATGAVTLTQLRAVEHATADTVSPYSGDTTGLGVADAIRLVGTISDDETTADTASDYIDISGNLSFTDDGPTIALTNEGGVLQTDDGDLAGGNEGDGTGTDTDTEGLGSLFSVVSSTGADTENDGDDIVYSLAVGANAATTLVDTATNEAVTVSLNGSGVIEGRTTGTNDLVFTVSVNAATGAVTLTQLRAVEHATADTVSPYSGDTTGLGVADAIRLVGTISDDETTADTASDYIDISGNLSFTDDGPTIALTNEGGVLQTDDGDLAGGNEGDGTGTDTDTEGLGSLFSVVSSTGADTENDGDDIVYSLAVGANAATTLVDTATNEAVTVSLNGSGVIEGRTTGTNDLVFTVSVNAATGAVTLTQLRAVEHATADTVSPYSGDTTGLGVADAIRLVGTISDDETTADTASDYIDISGNLSFTDDGPTIALTNEGGVLQTDDGDLAGGNEGDGTGTDTDTEGLGSLFSVVSSTGADTENDGDDIVYSLAVGANAATTLVDTATNEAVTVSLNGSGVIEGRTTGTNDLVFTVSVNAATGAVTLTQLRAVEHATADTVSPYSGDTTGLGVADAIRLVGTISDDETTADTASDYIDISGNLSFTDDGPTIALTNEGGVLQTDDGDLAGGNEGDGTGTDTDTEGLGSLFSVVSSTGADTENDGDDIVYSLAVGVNAATTLVDTATNEAVTVSLNGSGVIEGRTTGTNDLVFTVSVNAATGDVTLEQLRAVQHATIDTASPYSGDTTGLGVADAIRLVGTISDDETAADTATDYIDISANLSFTDDGPAIDPLILDTPVLAFVDGPAGFFSDSGFLSYGADGEGDFVITGFTVSPLLDDVMGTISGSISPDGSTLTLSASDDDFGDFFRVTLDGSAPGGYTAEVLIDAPIIEEALIEDTTTPGGPVEEINLPEAPDTPIVTLDGFIFTSQNTSDLLGTYLAGDKEVGDPEAASDDINISNKGAALKDQQFDPGEGLALNFHEDVAGVRFIVDGGTGSPGGFLTLKMAAYDGGTQVGYSEETFLLPKGNALQEVVFDEGVEFDQLILIHEVTDSPTGGGEPLDNGWRLPEIYAFTFADIPDIQGTVTVEATDGDFDEVADTFAYFIDGDGDGLV
ncbi:hypothetical protein BOX17_03700 [Halomonas aestuarii]|uniref:DUF5801 domain-containing protein n=2 Tax=Halomonas aestuarii TaxID=1897729 RepID=A0A1J0VDP3_9GAMM|nr:hypothetical protein BOX17_03700 [Halomonas aestuarii]